METTSGIMVNHSKAFVNSVKVMLYFVCDKVGVLDSGGSNIYCSSLIVHPVAWITRFSIAACYYKGNALIFDVTAQN
jgi:hypothetical protein